MSSASSWEKTNKPIAQQELDQKLIEFQDAYINSPEIMQAFTNDGEEFDEEAARAALINLLPENHIEFTEENFKQNFQKRFNQLNRKQYC